MRHITTILLLLTLAVPAVAQQWESFSFPNDAFALRKLRNLQNNLILSQNDGISRSLDGGDHWEQVYNYLATDYPLQLEVNRYNNRIYYAQSTDTSGAWGLHMSANMGDSWSYIGSISLGPLCFIKDTLYSFWHNNQPPDFLLSKKLGSGAWQPITSFPKDTAGNVRTFVTQGEHLWVLAGKGLYHSPDAGYHWELNLPLNNLPPSSPGSIIDRVDVAAVQNHLMIVNEYANKLYYSKDFGGTWEIIPWSNKQLSNSGEHLYTIDSSGTQLLRFEGNNAANWTKTPIETSTDISMDGVGEYEGTEWVLSNHFGVLRKRPNEPSWQVSNGNLSSYDGQSYYYWDHHLINSTSAPAYSADNGNTWKQNLFPYPTNAWRNGNYSYILNWDRTAILRCLNNERFEWSPYVNFPGRVSMVAASGDTLLALGEPFPTPVQHYRSLNNGVTWDSFPAQYGTPFISNKGKFYLLRQKSLYRSDDLGNTWPVVYTFPVSGAISKFHIVRDTIFVPYQLDDQIYYSTNQGQSFELLDAPKNPNTTAFKLRTFGDLMVLSMDDGLAHLSTNAGKTWTSLECPAGGVFWHNINDNKFVYGDNTLFIDGSRLRLDNQRQASGKVFLDLNGNGQKDLNEKGLNNLLIKNAQQQVLAVSYKEGDFSTLLGQGANALSVANVPTYYTVSPSTVPVPAAGVAIPPVLFAIKPQGSVQDMAVNITVASAFRAGYPNTLYLHAKNVGTVPKSGQLKLVLPPLLSATSLTPTTNLVSGDTLIWNYSNLALLSEFKVRVDFNTTVVPPGTPVLVRANVSGGLDVNPSNNTAIIDGQIVSSYDPNDKAVSEIQVPVNEAEGEELSYTIRFQNLGNIATDFITVRDTLSEAIDPSSVRVLATSHPYELKIEEGHILVFRFNPIRLAPASVDTVGSQGFVQFAARLKSGLEVGDEIANTAHIYFDFNPAVVTNTVVTQISVVSTFEPSRQVQAMEVFPNPASGLVTLRLSGAINSEGRVEIFSREGKLIRSFAAEGSNVQEIDLSGVVSGIYWCRWLVDGKVYWGELTILR